MAPDDTPPRDLPEGGPGTEGQDEVARWPMGRLLSTAARLVEHEWNVALARLDLTHAGLLTLHALVEGPYTQRQLAGLSHVEEQTMSRVLARLERSGFVTRERDRRDRRRMLVQLTPDGEAAYRRAVDSGTADTLVSDRLADPERFRADLVGLVRRLLAAQTREDDPPGRGQLDQPRDGGEARAKYDPASHERGP